MAAQLERFHYNAAAEGEEPAARASTVFRGFGAVEEEAPAEFTSDEAAARFHLDKLLEGDDRPAFRGVVAPERAELVPNLQLVGSEELPRTQTRLVRFAQTHDRIPVFGGGAVAELDENRNLVAADGALGKVADVSPIASLSPADALAAIAKFTDVEASTLETTTPPELNFFKDPEKGEWHLVYYFRQVPAAPPGFLEDSEGHGLAPSPRELSPLVDYLVDAHDGKVVYYFSSTPLLAIPVPSRCKGFDEDDRDSDFLGNQITGGFEMRDPLRDVETHDLKLADITTAITQNQVNTAALGNPVQNGTADWGTTARAAVSAHVNAAKVDDFYRGVLKRNGIDNQGMALVNVVNCTYARAGTPPAWGNAMWTLDRMWYGQVADASGRLVSFSRLLDVIAHELTHGVTEYSSALVYRDQSGALNESFSDIFGIIIRNWDQGENRDTWDWEIGAGIGPGGLPLRDMSDPTRTNDPAHMRDYVSTTRDSGGVHTNSNIHNKAAFNVLTAKDATGAFVFTNEDAAYLYYLTLVRLNRLATFSDVRATLVSVASTMYAGDEATRTAKVSAIEQAYDAVGIT